MARGVLVGHGVRDVLQLQLQITRPVVGQTISHQMGGRRREFVGRNRSQVRRQVEERVVTRETSPLVFAIAPHDDEYCTTRCPPTAVRSPITQPSYV